MTRAVLTPIDTTAIVDLGRTTFRKKLLHVGDLQYGDRKLSFTPAYLAGLVASFKDRAFDAVPLQLADDANRHTADPTRTRGNVTGLEATGDGLYATVSLTDDGAALVREHPELGVSVRIVEDLQRGDGKAYPAALEHVLATWNPRVNALGPWQAIDASSTDVDEVIDLTQPEKSGGPVVPEEQTAALSAEEIAKFREWLTAATEAEKPPENDEPSEEELAAIADRLIADAALDEQPAPVEQPAPIERQTIAASNVDGHALELANRRTDALEIELSRLRDERDTATFERERDTLATTYHIPPRITDLARPLLAGRRTVELSNGTEVDAADVMRTVLREMGKHMVQVDLSREAGTVYDTSRSEQDTTDANGRTAFAKDYLTKMGL